MERIALKKHISARALKGTALVLLVAMIMLLFPALPAVSETSPDASLYTANWLKNTTVSIPPGSEGSWDETGVGSACVIADGGTLKMWYTGYNDNEVMQIGYATSTNNGASWTKHNGGLAPVLAKGASGTWDASGVGSPCVIKVASDDYRMWYSGYSGYNTGAEAPQIGYATSLDGISWTRGNSGNPVLTPGASGAFDEKGVWSCWVLREDASTYKMWYTGRKGTSIMGTNAIGYAYGTDGIGWTRGNGNQAIINKGVSGTWSASGIAAGCVLYANGKYTLWYSGYTGESKTTTPAAISIGVAQSTDGITGWTVASQPVVWKETAAESPAWLKGAVGAPCVLEASTSKLVMWFSGVDNGLVIQQGYATVDTTAFSAQVTLQGGYRKDKGAAGFYVPLTMKLFDPFITLSSSNILTATPILTLTTDTGGGISYSSYSESDLTMNFTASVPSGLYKVSLHTPHCLINLKQVAINSLTGTVNMGTLLEGNADDYLTPPGTNQAQIFGSDFNMLLNDYLQTSTGEKWNDGRCDFDRNGQVTSIDFSLLSSNYTLTSPRSV